MRLRERINNEHDQKRQDSQPVASTGQNIDRQREAAQRLLEAGDDAISRALSGDSEAFLTANKQEGGQ